MHLLMHLYVLLQATVYTTINLLKKKTCALKNERLESAGYLLQSKAYTRL